MNYWNNTNKCKKKRMQCFSGCGNRWSSIVWAGLKGLVAKELPWMLCSWCMARRLEFAVRDELNSTAFYLVDDILLRLYLAYGNSPKKCRHLEEICTDLKQYIMKDTEEGKIQSVIANGSRWVEHK